MGAKEDKAEEIEITPEMIEAGVSALLDFDHDYESEDGAVCRIWRAMLAKKTAMPSP